MTLTVLLALALAVIVVIIVTWSVTYFALRRRMDALGRTNSRLQGEIELRMQLIQEKRDLKHELNEGVTGRIAMPDQGDDTLSAQRRDAGAARRDGGVAIPRSQTGEKIEPMVRPIREAPQRTEQRLNQLDHDRHEAVDALTEQLRSLTQTQVHIHAGDTERRPTPPPTAAYGHRGELTLARVIELAGMVEHCEMLEPDARADGAFDAIVHLPGDRSLVIDTKVPAEAFVRGMQADDAAQHQREMAHFAQTVRERVATLARASPPSRLQQSPEYVLLYLPGEPYLSAALHADPRLHVKAFQRNVLLASPADCIALLQLIALGWRQQALAVSARKMRAEGVRLLEQVRRFTEHKGGVGDGLHQRLTAYNRVASTLEHQHEPAAHCFTERGVDPENEVSASRGLASASDSSSAQQSSDAGDTGDIEAMGSPG